MNAMAYTLSQLSYRLGSQWVLTRLSFSIPKGATVLLTGANGAGKTTLLRLLATALRPTLGGLEILGHPAWPDPRNARAQVGLMTHQHHLYEDLTGRQNLQFICRMGGCGGGPSVDEVLHRVGLEPTLALPLRAYSAGMKRRLALGKMLLVRPQLILLDEPFGQLDPEGVTLVGKYIAEQKAFGNTLVVATHDIARGRAIATHTLHLEGAGRPVRLCEGLS